MRILHRLFSDFTFRLKGSESSNAGRVEVFVKGDWGKVCDNSWDLKDAGVLCRQLGFSAAVTTLSGSTFGEGTGTGIMDYIRCSGDEDSLAHCPHRRTHSCGIRSVAGVVCSPTDNSTKGYCTQACVFFLSLRLILSFSVSNTESLQISLESCKNWTMPVLFPS